MADETYKGDVLRKIAGVSFIFGAILTGVLDALFPRAYAVKSESEPLFISPECFPWGQQTRKQSPL